VATHLREALGAGVEVAAVTGQLPTEEREARVLALAGHERRVLVATDCLSEGINLQDHFDAVLHYDLSWNPTRHEQREGRIDRFGQQRDLVRTITYYGLDNRIDGIVLDVLIRKSKAIRKSLGVSVPVPEDTDSVMEAIFEGLLLREEAGFEAERLPGVEEFFRLRGVLPTQARAAARDLGPVGRAGEAIADDVRAGVPQARGGRARAPGGPRGDRRSDGRGAVRPFRPP